MSVDTLHGVVIEDPYQWLEDGDSPETAAWEAAQNAHTRSVLDQIPHPEEMRSRLTDLLSIGMIGTPVQAFNRLFYIRRSSRENQPKLVWREGVDGEDRDLVDPNRADAAGTTAIDWWYPSWDGRYVAFGYSTGGDEQSVLHVVDVETGEDLADLIPFTRFSTVAWLPDSSGFYYTSIVKQLATDQDLASAYYHRAVYLHRLGADQLTDQEIFPDDDDPETQPSVKISSNGRWLLVHVHRGWDRAHVFVLNRQGGGGEFRQITEGLDALFHPHMAGDTIYLHTNLDAPHYRLLSVDLNDPDQERWTEVIEEQEDAILEDVALSRRGVSLKYLRNAQSMLVTADRQGSDRRTIQLPELVTVTGLEGSEATDTVFFGLESFTSLPVVLRYTMDSGYLTTWQEVEAHFDASNLVTDQKWYRSKDGTPVSMFVTHRRGLECNGENPTVLTGYGGFNINRTPLFDRSSLLWLEAGGVLAIPNLRGGGEYGEEWHRAGMRANKQNVFDDFLAAAEYLIQERYSSPDRLGIYGGSNGGLLVGAAFTQRPELFAAVVCSVPLLDMLRYQNFLIARLWIPEYGSADNPDDFAYLRAYSPYHNVSTDREYPSVLFMTAASDSRVDPMHARKMTALLQSRARTKGPILIRIEFQAGHGAGKPVNKLVEQYTDMWSFLMWQLGVS